MAPKKQPKARRAEQRPASRSRPNTQQSGATSRTRPRKRKAKPNTTQTASLGRGAAKESQLAYNAMSKYLYGFVDPLYAGRGPTRSVVPTQIIHYRVTQDIRLSSFVSGWTPFLNTTGTYDTSGAFMLSPSGSIALLIAPQPCSNPITFGNYQPFSVVTGSTLDPDGALNISGYGAALPNTSVAKPYPLASFPETVPLDASNSGLLPTSWRCLGLRSVLTVTTPNMTAQGVVRAGDNRDFYAPEPNITYLANGQAGIEQMPGAINTTGTLRAARSLRKVGTFTTGAAYESVWLPGNDRATAFCDYEDNATWLRWDGSKFVSPYNSYAYNCLNGPMNVFILDGLLANQTFTLETIMAVEVPIRPTSTLSSLMQNARIGRHFVPEWNNLICMNAGNVAGGAALCMQHCSEGRAGLEMATYGIDAPGTVPNMATAQGPASPTPAIARSSGITKKQVVTDLGVAGAAQAAMSSTVRKRVSAWAGRGLSELTALAERALPAMLGTAERGLPLLAAAV